MKLHIRKISIIGNTAIADSSASTVISLRKGASTDDELPSMISTEPCISSMSNMMLIAITEMTAPVEATATRPKLSFSDDFESLLIAETPIARAIMNGTVIAPVVAPDASNDIARNSSDVKIAITNITRYSTVSSL